MIKSNFPQKNNPTAIFLLIALSCQCVHKIPLAASKPINFASPLKSLTIPDGEPFPTPRAKFLFKFKAGVEAERETRKKIAEEAKRLRQFEEGDVEIVDDDADFFESSRWATMSAEKFDSYKEDKRKEVASSFDAGFSSGASRLESVITGSTDSTSSKSANNYQFVGVVQPNKNVKWYARYKPKDSKWSVRVINVDKAALLRDLFVRGKIDLYSSYKNTGTQARAYGIENDDFDYKGACIEVEYTVKERSWKTLWNFSPKSFFTDRSGMYWRQRRLSPGIYTDGEKVYETSYHYAEGRNGMKLISRNLNEYFEVHPEFDKNNLLGKMNKGARPDLVLEY